jgi:6-pyruvoyltetrahydropterin/6-carboxytetrahydropterin synthase
VLYLTRRFGFSASHRLHSAALDAAGNACSYGICQNIHGHNYRLEVTVRGEPDPRTGFFCNVMTLHQIVHERIVTVCDHQYLNDLPLFHGVITTMEGLGQRIWNTIEPSLATAGMRLSELLVAETDEHWVRIRGE